MFYEATALSGETCFFGAFIRSALKILFKRFLQNVKFVQDLQHVGF